MLTHLHKCCDTLVFAHGSKGRSWRPFRCSASGIGRTRPMWGRTRPVWGRTCPRWAFGPSSLCRTLCVLVRFLSLHAMLHRTRRSWPSDVVSLCEALWVFVRSHSRLSGVFQRESLVQCNRWWQRLFFKRSRAPNAVQVHTGRVLCELGRVRCARLLPSEG